jgi:hypothetical protein
MALQSSVPDCPSLLINSDWSRKWIEPKARQQAVGLSFMIFGGRGT